MIVMIHSHVMFNFPLLRCAVPIFFTISSYLFFKKIKNVSNQTAHEIYMKFLKRALKLYLFWFIILIPYMIITKLMIGNLTKFIELLPINVFLRSTFPASWYISAYIIGISIMYKFRHNNLSLLIISIIFYIICCGVSNYGKLVFNIPVVEHFFSYENTTLLSYIKNIYLSFPVGLIFIWFGKFLVYRHIDSKKYKYIGYIGAIIGLILLFIENNLIISKGWRIVNDCYISMVLLAPSIFLTVLTFPKTVMWDSIILRKMSTIYYCSHIPLITLQLYIYKILHINISTLLLCICTLILCTIVALLFISLAKKSIFRALRFSY